MGQQDQRNLFLAIVLSLAILLGFQFFLPQEPPLEVPQTSEQTAGQAGTAPSAIPGAGVSPSAPSIPGAPDAANITAAQSRGDVLASAARVAIETPKLKGSISLTGGRLDDLVLTQLRETLEEGSPNIVLLSPFGTPTPYFADFGWLNTGTTVAMPDSTTVWTADRNSLTPQQSVTLRWDNGQGLQFEKTFEVDENYLFTIHQRVVNNSDKPFSASPYGLINRTGTPETLGFYILHEGLVGVLNENLQEIDYSDVLEAEKGTISETSNGGWLGITDKYWGTALIPDQSVTINTRFYSQSSGGTEKYQTDYLYKDGLVAAPGSSVETTNSLFAGAKVVSQIDGYEERLGVKFFDKIVDFGWFYYITKPLFYALHWLNEKIGNFGVAILVLTVFIKLIFFPLANKSYKAMAKMRKLQPEMLELRERFGDDKQRLNQEMMALYKREGANPMSGCLPIIVQIPVFFALYKVMFVTIEMRQAPFFGWIKDLSAPDPTSIINGFGLFPWDAPELGVLNVINLGVWPLIMGITMFLQQRLNPQPPDPVQAKIFLFMPIMFTFLLATFPAGLVIYWAWNNTLSIIQQAVIMKRAGVPIGNKPAKT
ncbi:membrane protein insertase YidC [Pelagibius sp. Alg239-R121]|uniref:membrane protein insertase YidC n=1 Tax=Pelagibius sp. Alg239-R121 TaxID=2993448 RepID=UPI0024A63950|nr:membrane protein insertase YidC [Pelagibius sp. Alg239-R121]